MARAMWRGSIKLGKRSIGVKLYSAVEDHQLHFHLLHASDHQRVHQRMLDPATGEAVPPSQVRKGFPLDASRFVVLEARDLAELEPKPSREIEIARCVPQGSVDPQWYDRPYFLGPDGPGEGYFALVAALTQKKRVAIARFVMRKREYSGAIAPHGDHLVMFTLRDATQVIDASNLIVPEGRALDAKERALAEQLIGALEGSFDPEEFQDEYRKQVLALIDAKAHGKKPKLKPLRSRKPSGDALTGALQASLRKLKEAKSA